MKLRTLYFLTTIMFISLLFANGCLRNSTMIHPDKLDAELAKAIKQASNGEGVEYFILPNSNEYSKIPQDPSNPITDAKVELGKLLFHETGLAVDPIDPENYATWSCASCHHVDAGFQAGRMQGMGEGGSGFGTMGEGRVALNGFPEDSIDVQPIRSPSAMNGAYQDCQLWNGQFGATGPNRKTKPKWKRNHPTEKNFMGYQGLETQAIAAMDVHKLGIDTNLIFGTEYKQMFDEAFPHLPASQRYTKVTAGLAIAAYERTMLSNKAPWQRYLRGDKSALTANQKRGALVFFKEGKCVSCHTGPALNEMMFYALGMKDLEGFDVFGTGADQPTRKGRGGFTGNTEDNFKFKVPQLYNLKDIRSLGHGSSFRSVKEVVRYKNIAKPQNRFVPMSALAEEFVPLQLDGRQEQALVDFIENALYDDQLERYVPEKLPSGNCFPNNDMASRADLGCK